MIAAQVFETLCKFGAGKDYTDTCDGIKAGSGETEVSKVAVAMTATVDIVRRAAEWGAQMLIVHEPTYYNHMDEHSEETVEAAKRSLIDQTGLAIYRFHDHAHRERPDMICAGEVLKMALGGETEFDFEINDLVRIKLDEPMTAVELAKKIEQNLGIKHLRICGARDIPSTNISARFGAPFGTFDELMRPETEMLLTGESNEWTMPEYARDAAQLGFNKTVIIMGHVGSERDGMVYIADRLAALCPELEVRYFDCGEVYTYTDSEV